MVFMAEAFRWAGGRRAASVCNAKVCQVNVTIPRPHPAGVGFAPSLLRTSRRSLRSETCRPPSLADYAIEVRKTRPHPVPAVLADTEEPSWTTPVATRAFG